MLANRTAPRLTLIQPDDPILITGASGFIGGRVVKSLIDHGFRHLRCLVRVSSDTMELEEIRDQYKDSANVEIVMGNLLSAADCRAVTETIKVIYHLAAGRGEKFYSDAYLNSVVTTRNLLEASLSHKCLKRFVTISSFSVYSNVRKTGRAILDECSEVESRPDLRGDAYAYAKVKQDEIIVEYGQKHKIPYVIVRPGYVFGPGKDAITGRVGIGTFGLFLHLGGANQIPLTYVDNCAEAIVLAGLTPGVDGEVFNVVDDDLLSSRKFLRLYKKRVRRFRSLYVPKIISYSLCYLWEKYADWSNGQLPPTFNRKAWRSYWRKTKYSNAKLKAELGWMPKIPTDEALEFYFAGCRAKAGKEK